MFCHEQEMVKLIGVAGQNYIHSPPPYGKHCRAEPEVDDAGMRSAQPEDDFAEVPIIGNDDASFGIGEGKNLLILEPGVVVSPDSRDIVA
jgi:hypothetical protein